MLPKVGFFGIVLQKVLDFIQARSILGPDVLITSPEYGSTECIIIGIPLNPDDPETFVIGTTDVVEYLVTEDGQRHENTFEKQPKLYERPRTTPIQNSADDTIQNHTCWGVSLQANIRPKATSISSFGDIR